MAPITHDLADWLGSEDAALFSADIVCWATWYKHTELGLVERFQSLFQSLSEFRTLFDYRAKTSSAGKRFEHYEAARYRRANDLYIRCPSIGPRMRIQHGHSTWVYARSIGADFWVNQNVTIGSNGHGPPTFGDGVTVSVGAVVVGPVTVGDNCHISANAVVSEDIPPNSRVYAARSVIVPKPPR